MLTEAVQDAGQAMRDPVGGSVEFHFVPILKLISTLLIMGVFEDADVKHILKLIEPSVFSDTEVSTQEQGDGDQQPAGAEDHTQDTRRRKLMDGEHEDELLDEGLAEEEEEDEELEEEEEEEEDYTEKEEEESALPEKDREKAAGQEEELEAEPAPGREESKEQDVGEGLLHMKLPESVKLQVNTAPPTFISVDQKSVPLFLLFYF